jgi:hypothetical protein
VPDRRGSRFVVEVLFLLALTVGLTLAELSPLVIAGVMLLGWVIVAALEWAAWRTEPHFGSGLPPRYYVPRVNLPPPQPLEQVAPGYPEAVRDEAPTWIASAALREEMLGEWPMAAPVEREREAAELVQAVAGPAADPWLVAELPAAPLEEPEPRPAAEPPVPGPSLAAVRARPLQGVANYNLDPLADPPPRRRLGRRSGEAPATIEVPARPEGVRSLPGRLTRQD